MKSENPFEDEGMLGQYGMGYSPLAGMDVGDTYQDSNPHVSFFDTPSIYARSFSSSVFELKPGFGGHILPDSDKFKVFRALANRNLE